MPKADLRCHAQTEERGSALLLVPTAFLIVIMLASFSLNSAMTFLAEQELDRAASAAANDAISALNGGDYFGGSGYLLADGLRQDIIADSIQARTKDSVRSLRVSSRAIDIDTVEVTATGFPRIASWRFLPWTRRPITVVVNASAVHR